MNNPLIGNHRETLSLLSDLCQVARCCRQDAVFCEDVTFTQFLILDEISKRTKLKMSELHRILAVDKSTTTRLVNPLVKRGLVQRKKSDRDLRSTDLILTRDGEALHIRVWQCLIDFFEAIGKEIPEEKRREVYGAMESFLMAVKNAALFCKCATEIEGK